MATIAEALNLALEHHRAGNLDAAERLYREILAHESRQADAWHLLGLVCHARGRHADAIQHIERAIALDGAQASFHNHLGEALLAAGRLTEAETSCRRGLTLQPDFAIGHNTLGTVLAARSASDEAIASYRRAIELAPQFAQAHYNLGLALESQGAASEADASYRAALAANPDYPLALHALGALLQRQVRHAEAIELYRRLVELQPDHGEGHCNLGSALKDLNRTAEASACYERALSLVPDLAEAHFSLGVIFQGQQQWSKAEEAYRRAVAAKPDYPEALNNLGTLCRNQGKLDEAIGYLERVLELRPDFAEALNNLGNVFMLQGRRTEAMVCYDQTLRMRPDYAQAHTNRALARLCVGRFDEGWPEYEWRWEFAEFKPHGRKEPLWDGSALEGRKLLVHAEQGLGDTLQFSRYVPLIAARGGEVVFEVQEPLAPLMRQACMPGVVARGETLPACDVQIPLMSLPFVFVTTYETIPHEVPYLAADPALVEQWRQTIGHGDRLQVAIAWQGSITYRADRFRSIPLGHFRQLALDGVELISLQKGIGSEQTGRLTNRFPLRELGEALDRDHGAFMDTAAIMKCVDLVITSDTSVAHLAGALGVPTWIALPYAPDWRWHIDRDDSPWYPTVRLFRQTTFDDWSGVFERLAQALRDEVARR